MEPKQQNSMAYSGEATLATFIQRVYFWMALGLGLTALTAFATVLNVGLLKFLMKGGIWLFIIAQFVLVLWLSASIQKISAQAAVVGFLIYSALNGVTISIILLMYTAASIFSTFLIAAGMFAGVSIYGWVTKQDLTSIGSFCGMAIWGLIIASIVNMFFASSALYWIISYAGVAIFIGLTAYDTQWLKKIHRARPNAPDQIAIIGALKLYLDFILMFLYLLRIFGRSR